MFKKKDIDLEAMRDISGDVKESDFVPFSIHYDPETILTKNGELLQTIKITGFAHEDITQEDKDLRATIREALLGAIQTTDYAAWFHTIRRKKNIAPKGLFRKDFSGYLNQCWRERNNFDGGYINEVYLTIVKEGEVSSLLDPKEFLYGLLPGALRKKRFSYLEKAASELSSVVEQILGTLEHFGARRLGVVERDGVYYSQLCSFLGKLTTLTDHPWPLPDADISRFLTDYDVTFGYNAMEVRNADGARRFGAMLSLKEYKELNLNALDRFLQLPIEFVITQCIDFINHKQALKEYQYQHKLLEISEKEEFEEKIGLKSIIDSNRGSPVDFGEQQLNVFLLSDTLKILEYEVKTATDALMNIGIIPMREDLKLEECYWAMLPANFEFLKRLKPINTRRIAGFCNLSNFPAGISDNNYWGPAVSLFYTAANTPYYFNFHVGDNGHTSIIGPFGAGKTVLTNFLISESRKFGNRLFYFDQMRASEIFIRSIGGDYLIIGSGSTSPPRMNPLLLEDNEMNRSFLEVWLESLLINIDTSKKQEGLLSNIVRKLYELSSEQRTLQTVFTLIQAQDNSLADSLADWLPDGKYGYVFNHTKESLDFSRNVIGFDVTALTNDEKLMVPVLSYLIHRATLMLDGAPSMIVFDEAWKLLDNEWFGPRLAEWLESIREQNTVAVFATENVGHAMQSVISPILMEQIATQIFLPDSDIKEEYITVFNLTDQEVSYVYNMRSDQRQFLLKRGLDTIVGKLDLSGMDDVLGVLSATPERIQLMENVIAAKGAEPTKWLPEFFKKL
jgi:type IV secretion system protein VirB4